MNPLRRVLPFALVLGLAACSQGTTDDPGGPGGPPDPSDPSAAEIALEPVADGFTNPLGVVTRGSDLYVLEQGGTVRVVRNGSLLPEPFLEIPEDEMTSVREQGLLGMAFRPGAGEPPQEVFVHYTNEAGDTVLSLLPVVGGSAVFAEEQVLLTIDHPNGSEQHYGGQLAFGPDGMLYMALGDGATDEPLARDPGNPHGSILRMNVDPANLPPAPATPTPADLAPADNPFADGTGGHPLVLHYGLRNPWRFSFDGNDLWIADVGESATEEIDRVAADASGLDFGWNVMEGDHCYPSTEPCDFVGTLPDATYDHADGFGQSITGGYVYRGDAIPELQGAYVFGDFIEGSILAAEATDDGEVGQPVLLQDTERMIASFGVGADGELLVVDYAAGALLRIVPE